jgi:hypothetical protein
MNTDKSNVLVYVMILFVIFICFRLYKESEIFQLKCVVSSVDGNKYCVREREKIEEASNLLATTTKNMSELINHLENRYPDKENVKRLINNYNPKKIIETLPTSEYTAYSENKGEKIAFCLNKDNANNDGLIDQNTLMFVALHELGHLATKTIGHNDEFWRNFKFLLVESESIGIYKPVDYKNENYVYCGMEIKDNPYYDLK